MELEELNEMIEDISKKLHGKLTMFILEFIMLSLGVYKAFNQEVNNIA